MNWLAWGLVAIGAVLAWWSWTARPLPPGPLRERNAAILLELAGVGPDRAKAVQAKWGRAAVGEALRAQVVGD